MSATLSSDRGTLKRNMTMAEYAERRKMWKMYYDQRIIDWFTYSGEILYLWRHERGMEHDDEGADTD